jgi:hypothetical protein
LAFLASFLPNICGRGFGRSEGSSEYEIEAAISPVEENCSDDSPFSYHAQWGFKFQ